MNDLVGLFRPPNDKHSVNAWQGVVVSWNAATGQNTVQVAGGLLTNVSALKACSATIAQGDVVNLISVGGQWVILGNVTTPGIPGTVPTWNADIAALIDQVNTIETDATIVRTTDTQTLTNKNLSSNTNNLGSIPYSVAANGTTDASGFLTVTHGAPWTPVGGWWVNLNPNGSFAQFWGIDTIGATTVRLRFCTTAGTTALASTAVQGRLFLVRP